MSARPRDVLREKGTPALAFSVLDPAVNDDAIVAYPVLANRPIVVRLQGARLARPSEAVLDLPE